MRVSSERHLAHSLKQRAERGIAGEICSEYECVYEETNQSFGFSLLAACYWRAHNYIGLPGVAIQQGLKNREPRHEESHSLLASECLQRIAQIAWQNSS